MNESQNVCLYSFRAFVRCHCFTRCLSALHVLCIASSYIVMVILIYKYILPSTNRILLWHSSIYTMHRQLHRPFPHYLRLLPHPARVLRPHLRRPCSPCRPMVVVVVLQTYSPNQTNNRIVQCSMIINITNTTTTINSSSSNTNQCRLIRIMDTIIINIIIRRIRRIHLRH